MKNLYYTVEKETQTIDTVEECTGLKIIRVYEIVSDKPKLWVEIEALLESNSKGEIHSWLGDNGYGDREYQLVQL